MLIDLLTSGLPAYIVNIYHINMPCGRKDLFNLIAPIFHIHCSKQHFLLNILYHAQNTPFVNDGLDKKGGDLPCPLPPLSSLPLQRVL